MYYAGLDLHKRYFTLCVLTSEGQVVQDHRRLPADLPLRRFEDFATDVKKRLE
jgi:hypothetical protein